MIHRRPWYQQSPQRLKLERLLLGRIDYFHFEQERFDEQKRLIVVGTIEFRRSLSGKHEEFRIRVEYPEDFPRRWQRVFDHDKRFEPGADGHLLNNHQICLTYPDRKEFAAGSDQLTEEVLGATLVWFQKRLIYERSEKRPEDWPGKAERHGALAKIDLVLEQAGLDQNPSVVAWANELYCSSLTNGNTHSLDVYSLCPCKSGKKLKFCCYEGLRPVLKFIRATQGHAGLLQEKTP